ncbi:hypothetical protein Tco_1363114 [Tanacetum coccineum]
MHTRTSNSELVEPLPEPEHTLNHRRNRRVPFDQRNNPPQNPRIVYPLILNINYFRHFLITLKNLYPIDDEPMWAANRVVALTLGFAITIPEIANEFAIKGNALKQPWSQSIQRQYYQNLLSWSQQNNPRSSKCRDDAMTIKMDAQYKELQSRAKKPTPDLDEDDMPMSHEEEAKFMQTFY